MTGFPAFAGTGCLAGAVLVEAGVLVVFAAREAVRLHHALHRRLRVAVAVVVEIGDDVAGVVVQRAHGFSWRYRFTLRVEGRATIGARPWWSVE